MYTQFFTSISNIKNIEELLPGSEKHISCNALLLFIFASQALPTYSDLDTPLEHCCTILNDNFKEKFCRILKVNERTYKRNIKELVDANLLVLTNKKEHLYAVNPLITSKIGTFDDLQYTRNFLAAKNIFGDVCCISQPKAAKNTANCSWILTILVDTPPLSIKNQLYRAYTISYSCR